MYDLDDNQCQQIDYHVLPDLMTLQGIKPPHFGMKKKASKQRKNENIYTYGIDRMKRLKERFPLSGLSFQNDT